MQNLAIQEPWIESATQAPVVNQPHLKLVTFDQNCLIEFPVSEHFPVERPLFLSKVYAGFPSPADDQIEMRLDPNKYLVDNEVSTFFYTMEGLSMIDLGLLPGDKLTLDRSKHARINNVILARVNGGCTVKILGLSKNGNPRLVPANSDGQFPTIEINEFDDFEILGVVISSFRRFR
ncbi:MAG: S24 family peptidase [Pseudomonadota bacterium]